jgi:hypothetical protein
MRGEVKEEELSELRVPFSGRSRGCALEDLLGRAYLDTEVSTHLSLPTRFFPLLQGGLSLLASSRWIFAGSSDRYCRLWCREWTRLRKDSFQGGSEPRIKRKRDSLFSSFHPSKSPSIANAFSLSSASSGSILHLLLLLPSLGAFIQLIPSSPSPPASNFSRKEGSYIGQLPAKRPPRQLQQRILSSSPTLE